MFASFVTQGNFAQFSPAYSLSYALVMQTSDYDIVPIWQSRVDAMYDDREIER
jgi:hypothetical protein